MRQISLFVNENFLELIDKTANLTGSTRSDLIRRSIEVYIQRLKESTMFSSLEGGEDEN